MKALLPQSTAPREKAGDETKPCGHSGQPPVERFREGPVQASIWENQGPKGAFRTAAFQLRYKDSKHQWQTSHSYGVSDLAHLERAAHEARKRIETWLQSTRDNPGANHS